MVDMTFEPQMLETLAKMKGKMFKSFEARFPVPKAHVIPDRVRISLGTFAVDIRCWYKEVDSWREVDEDDPPYVLSCEEVPLGEPFPSKAGDVHAVLVGERITGVDVVTYHIEGASRSPPWTWPSPSARGVPCTRSRATCGSA